MSADPASDEDEAFVAAARAGSVRAFEALYRRHAARVNALCWRMTGSRVAAEDCVQETFVQAWQNLERFEGRSRFTTWLHRVAVNVVLGWQRAESRRPSGQPPAQAAEDYDPADPLTVDAGLDLELERAVTRLPVGARNVLILHLVHGYSHEETAALLGIAPGTSKAQLHRARQLLEEALR